MVRTLHGHSVDFGQVFRIMTSQPATTTCSLRLCRVATLLYAPSVIADSAPSRHAKTSPQQCRGSVRFEWGDIECSMSSSI